MVDGRIPSMEPLARGSMISSRRWVSSPRLDDEASRGLTMRKVARVAGQPPSPILVTWPVKMLFTGQGEIVLSEALT
jgi:hypothetical protein